MKQVTSDQHVAMVSGLLLAGGVFLPWISASILSLSGWAVAPEAKLLALFGAVVFFMSLSAVQAKKRAPAAAWLIGLASICLMVFLFLKIREKMMFFPSASYSFGFWISATGAVLASLSWLFHGGQEEAPEEK